MKEQIYCKFRFLCDRKWDDLQKIEGDEKTRFCTGCEKPVYLCSSYEELAINAAARRCVAVRAPSTSEEMLLDSEMQIGDVDPETWRGAQVIDSIFQRPVVELELSKEIEEKLLNSGVKLIRDLVLLTDFDLVSGYSLTDQELREVKEALASRRLSPETRDDDWDFTI